MTTRTSSVPKAVAPLVLGAVLGVATLSQRATEFGGQRAAPAVVGAVLAVLATVVFIRVERIQVPSLQTHLRHCLVLYLAALFGWAMQGEGLTAPTGKLLVLGAVVMITSNAVTLLLARKFPRGRPPSVR